MTELRIVQNRNPMEQNLGILPMSREDEAFWARRRGDYASLNARRQIVEFAVFAVCAAVIVWGLAVVLPW